MEKPSNLDIKNCICEFDFTKNRPKHVNTITNNIKNKVEMAYDYYCHDSRREQCVYSEIRGDIYYCKWKV